MKSFSNVLCLKRRLRGDLIALFTYLMGWYKGGARLFLEVHNNSMKGNGPKSQDRKIWLETWKKLVTTRVEKAYPDRLWNLHPQKCSKFKWSGPKHPKLVWSAPGSSWTRWPQGIPSNIKLFYSSHAQGSLLLAIATLDTQNFQNFITELLQVQH